MRSGLRAGSSSGTTFSASFFLRVGAMVFTSQIPPFKRPLVLLFSRQTSLSPACGKTSACPKSSRILLLYEWRGGVGGVGCVVFFLGGGGGGGGGANEQLIGRGRRAGIDVGALDDEAL